MLRSAAGGERTLVSCGRWDAASESRVVIVDAEVCQELPDDHVGEIWVRGPQVARGYFGQPEQTAATFHARETSMGLLDGSPNDWLDLFRNSAQNQNLKAGIGADSAGQTPFGWQAPAQQPPPGPGAPLSLAPPPAASDGPGLGDRLAAGFQSWVHTPVGNPLLGLANGVHGFANGQRLSVHDRQCAEQAWGRATEYFRKHLG